MDENGRSETLNTLLDSTAARCPRRTAMLVTDSPRSHPGEERAVTFAELQDLVLRAAAMYRSRGVRKGDCVALILRNGLGFVTAYLGLSRLGAIAVPVNFMVQKAEELRYMLNDCSAKGVVTQREFLREILKARKELPLLDVVWLTEPDRRVSKETEDFWGLLQAQEPEPRREDAASPQDTAAVLYTSGTTGKPKGVMLTHANLVANCDASVRVLGADEKDVSLCILPMFHTFAWTACVLIPLRLGVKSVVASSIAPAKPWLTRMGRHRVTIFSAVPQVYAVLAKQACGLKKLLLRYWFFRGVRFCVSGAAPLPPKVASDFSGAMGREIIEGYGLTETSPVATINPPRDIRRGTVGRAIEGVRLRVVDDDGRELPIGEEGEICIAGHNIMKGYLNLPEATRQVLSADGWLRTGDIGVLDADGYLSIRDRKKDMIIVKGLKVFSAQVEAVLLAHPDVQEAAVVGLPDETGDEVIKAFIVLRKEARADKAEFMRFIRENLDAYKRPRDVEFLDELPKNALQKVLKRVLRQKELERRAVRRMS
ncbi:MAG: long-chain-fatty-acid--CoA ligase [Elusimicrobiota bacterium]